MEDKNIKFLQILSQLPEEVNLYFSSIHDQKDRADLALKYGLSSDDIYDIIVDYFVSDFKIEVITKSLEEHQFNLNNSKDFIIDFLGKIFLPLEGFLNLDIKKEIKERGGNPDNYKKNIDNLKTLIEDTNFDIVADLVEDFLEDFDEEEEEKIVINYLEEDLLELLLDSDTEGSQYVNGSLLYLLINKPDSLNKFSRALMSNKELISSQGVLVDGKEQEPSIANWITHFIKENGSDMPNNIALAKYLSSSSEVLKLSSGEKSLLRKVLKLYKNLVFFPDSMTGVPREDWVIIPLDVISEPVFQQKVEKAVPASKPEKVEKKVDNKKPAPVIKKKLEKPVEDPKIVKLKKSLEQYPANSLERKAIESEIKKLSQKA